MSGFTEAFFSYVVALRQHCVPWLLLSKPKTLDLALNLALNLAPMEETKNARVGQIVEVSLVRITTSKISEALLI